MNPTAWYYYAVGFIIWEKGFRDACGTQRFSLYYSIVITETGQLSHASCAVASAPDGMAST